MATVSDCEQAFVTLAARLAEADPATRRKNSLDRRLSCTLRDLGVTFAGQIKDGLLVDVQQVPSAKAADANVKLTMTSDDLIALVAGNLNLASAWTSGRVKIDARVFDLIKLRSIF